MGSNPAEGAINLDIMSELEEKIVKLRKEGLTYKSIRLKLGNPSNKKISETLNAYCPELAGDTPEWIALRKELYGN